MTTLVFGHKSPDTDSTGSPIIWAWYLNEIKGEAAKPVLLGEPNTEAAFVLSHWNLDKPEIISGVDAGTPVVIVDTNNPAELPADINSADIRAIIDHHKLVGGLETKGPIDIRIEPLACTATIMHKMIGDDLAQAPKGIKGAMLSCILSDTLEFRSPTTTQEDKAIAHALADDLGVDLSAYASQMFEAKSDVSAFSDAELLRMDSKEYTVDGKDFRVSVLETTAPKLVLDRNPTDFHTQIEQAAFEPNNMVPGVGLSPDKMLLARGFSYADAHRARLGVNYKEIPVNSPKTEVHSYTKDGKGRVTPVSDPVYAPNSYGGPSAQPDPGPEAGTWHSDGDMIRSAYTLRPDDDDWSQAGKLVRDVMDDAARARLVDNVAGHLCDGVSEKVLQRAFDYWRNIDRETGDRIESKVRDQLDGASDAPGMASAQSIGKRHAAE